MVIEDIIFTLKDGRQALLRSPREEDVQPMIDYLRTISSETEFVIRYPEECDFYTYEGERAFLAGLNASEKDVMLVCLVDGQLAGNCHLSFHNRIKTKHRAGIAIALLSQYWNLGIGTRMFEEMTRICTQHKDTTQMELEFIEGNARARHLYEKMGFRIVGVRPDAYRLKDGSMRNEYIMIKKI